MTGGSGGNVDGSIRNTGSEDIAGGCLPADGAGVDCARTAVGNKAVTRDAASKMAFTDGRIIPLLICFGLLMFATVPLW
jgi:hypothetical protein